MTQSRRVSVRTTAVRSTAVRSTALPSPHAPAPVPTPFGLDVRTACTGLDPEIFFDEEDPAPAVAICQTCPARAACLAYAVANEEYGVWGGATPQERAAMRDFAPVITPEARLATAEIQARVNSGAPVDEIAREYKVSTRTVARWLSDWRASGSDDARGSHAA